MRQIYITLFICILAFAGCKSSKKATSRQKTSEQNKELMNYQEDLSVLRPSYKDSLTIIKEASSREEKDTLLAASVVPKQDITQEMDNFLEAVAEREKEYDIRVYTLQIYLGTDRQTAAQLRNKANSVFAHSEAKMLFEAPFYKVHVGEFTDRVEANEELYKAEKIFQNVSLVPIRLDTDEF